MSEHEDGSLFCGGERKCGNRKERGVYLCTGTDEGGRPVEDFVIDSAIPYTGKPFRAPMLIKRGSEIVDVLIWVGEEFYPTAPDFLNEVRLKGVSRRVGDQFPMGRLTAGVSRMVFVHAKAVVNDLSHLDDLPVHPACVKGQTPHSCTFQLENLTDVPEVEYSPGVFFATVVTHAEYIRKSGAQEIPAGLAEAASQAGIEVFVCKS